MLTHDETLSVVIETLDEAAGPLGRSILKLIQLCGKALILHKFRPRVNISTKSVR